MGRIRSDKPEAYQSETLAEISVAAERTFKGMATIADDRGRLADKPAQINGELWSMRGNHTRDDLEAELAEMVSVGLICRYTGCDGKRYLHFVTWDRHQKIDRPSKSRLPRCPRHRDEDEERDRCGHHEGECKPREDSREAGEVSRVAREGSRDFGEGSMQDLGSRTVDLGSRTMSPPHAGAHAHARETPRPGMLANSLLDEHTRQITPRPPRDVTRRTGEQIDKMLDDPEIKPDEITEALALLRAKPNAGPGLLPDLVHEVRQRNANGSRASPRRGHQPYQNPASDSAYEETL